MLGDDATGRERELLGAIPYQPNEAVLHTDERLLPRRRRAWASWNYHLLDDADRPADRHLPHEPPAVAARRPRVLRDAQPHRGDRPGARSSARSSTRIRSSRRRARARRRAYAEISGARPHALLRRLLGLGLPRGRRGQRRCASRASSGSRVRVSAAQRPLRGHRAPPPLRRARRTRSATGSRWPTSTSTSCRACSAAAWCAAGPASCASAARDYLGDPAVPLADAVRALVAERTGRAPDGPDPAAHAAAHASATASTRSASTTASTRDGALHAVVAEVTNTPWGERHAYVLEAGDGPGRRAAASTRRCTSRRSWAWTSATRLATAPAPATDAVGAHREPRGRRRARSTRRSRLRRRR